MIRHKFDISILICVSFTWNINEAQLIRPIEVYNDLIRGIHDHFNNTCVILLHATPNPIEGQGLYEADALLKLQRYLSGPLHTRTACMDFDTFKQRVGQSYFHIKRPLFVLLNDGQDIQAQFKNDQEKWITMSYPTWLIFFHNDTEIEQFFKDIYIPFDCIFLVTKQNGPIDVITEVYQIDRSKPLKSNIFGTWHPKKGLQPPKLSLYQRRNNLYGHNIRVASVVDPPVSILQSNEQGDLIGLDGFFGGILGLLQEGLNCTFTFQKATSWGIYLPNGTWTGAIGMLVEDQVDLVASELMMTSDRLDAVEFTTPVYSTKCRTFIKRPDTAAIKWEAYTAPFNASIWNTLGIFILVSSSTIMIMKLIIKLVASFLDDSVKSPTRFSEILFSTFAALCNQGVEESSLDPVRIVYLVVHLTGVIILAAYSAALISFLATQAVYLPFTTMDGLLEDGTYRFAVVGESSDYSFFQNTSDKTLEKLFDEVLAKETSLPGNYFEGLTRLCEEDRYAFMALDNMAAVLQQNIDCVLEPLDSIIQITVAMAVGLESPYRGIINNKSSAVIPTFTLSKIEESKHLYSDEVYTFVPRVHWVVCVLAFPLITVSILLFGDSGIMHRLLQSEWSLELNRPKSTWSSVQIPDVLPLILFIFGGILFSGFLVLVERFVHQKYTTWHIMRRKMNSDRIGKIKPGFKKPLKVMNNIVH